MPEVRRLLRALSEPPARRPFHLHWSRWRRTHQFGAWRGHVARRAAATRDRPTPPLALGPRPPSPPTTALPALPALPDTDASELTDAQWARVRVLLPERKPRGRPPCDPRAMLAAVLWVTRANASWRAVPARFGPWPTVYTHYRRWVRAGLWPRLIDALQQMDTGDPTRDREVSL